jgi:hypothetical protein
MSILKLTLDWRAYTADTSIEIQERQTQNLYSALEQFPDVEQVARLPDPNVPSGGMGAAWLTNLLLTEIFPGSLSSIFSIIQLRLPGTPMDVELEVDGTKIILKGVRPEDFDARLDKLQQTVEDLRAHKL